MKKMLLKTTLILLIIFLFLAMFLIINSKITGNSIDEKMFTKAICDKNNNCQDYKIICENNKLKSFTSTGMAVQNLDNWNDPRTPEQIKGLCG